ncbi:MAG: ParB/RepB/Spo0J family partition protein [Cyclobacteriaceae bacterium]
MSKKKNALGRGLSALLSDTPESDSFEEVTPPSTPSSSVNEIPIEQIETNPFQPRTHFEQEALNELAASIKVHGIIQPITVRKLSQKQYQLIAGERRFQAAKIAGLTALPAFVRSANDQQMLEMALIENIQRENLNPIEVALSYQRLISEINLKQEELGDRVGKNRSTVTNYLRLLKLPPDIQIAVRDNKLSMGHARAIINVDNSDTQLYIFKKIITEDLSVRKVEQLVRQLMGTGKGGTKPAEKVVSGPEREIKQLQSTLSTHFGTKVNVKSDGKKGEIRIPFLSVEDLNRILEILKV